MAYTPLPEFSITSTGYVPDPTYIFPVLDGRVSRLEIEFVGLQPVASIGVSVEVQILDIVLEPLQLLGPLVYIRKKVISSRLWFFVLHGIDSYLNITIPISRFTESLNVEELNQYSVTVPDGAKYLPEIILRKQSTFSIITRELFTDGTYEDAHSRIIPLTGVRSDKGANSQSVLLTGQIEPIVTEFKKLDVFNISYLLNPEDEKRTIRCEDNKDFAAGDVAVFEGTELKTATVTRIISATQQTMQLKEA